MKHADFIKWVPLTPYSPKEELLVITGYSSNEVLEYLDSYFTAENFNMKSLKNIKSVLTLKDGFKFGVEKFKNLIDEANEDKGNLGTHITVNNAEGDELYIIVLRKSCDRENYNDVVTVAHEVIHLCQDFLPRFLNRDEEKEAEAYFHSYICEKILE